MARQLLGFGGERFAYIKERPAMSVVCQISSIELIAIRPLWSRPTFLFQGNSVTAAVLKVKAFLHAFKTKSPRSPPDPGGRKDPPQSAAVEDYWNDPTLWMLMFH